MTEKRLSLIGQQLDYILSELVNQITDNNIEIDDSVQSYYKPPVKSYMPDNGKAFMHGWLERNAVEIPDSIGLEFILPSNFGDSLEFKEFSIKQR